MNQYDPLADFSLTTEAPSATLQPNLFGALDEGEAPPVGSRRRSKRSVSVTAGKNYILDTNVLLHDPHCIGRFADNHVWIPVDVLAELDRFKNEQSERGANARSVHRSLAKVFADKGNAVTTGIPTEGGGSLRLVIFDPEESDKRSAAVRRFHRVLPDRDRVDHRILACILQIQEKQSGPAILVSKDLNMQLKAMAVGLQCEDYLNDKVEVKDVENYDPHRIEVHPHELQRYASTGEIALDGSRIHGLAVNEYVLLATGDRQTIPARHMGNGEFRHLRLPEAIHVPKGTSLKPMNLGQQCFLDALLDPEISLVTCYGQAGTGKTLLAVAAGLHMVFGRTYNGMTVSRPVVAMGDTLGFLPGTLDEKMRPWLQPIYDAFDLLMPAGGVHHDPPAKHKTTPRKHKGPQTHQGHDFEPVTHSHGPAKKPYETLLEQGIVEIEALCYIRGRSIPRRFFVLDEAQQLTPLEAKTVITRMSKGSKLIMVGDPAQIDNPYVDSRSNGLVYTRNRLKDQSITAHVCLNKGERSHLAEIGAHLM